MWKGAILWIAFCKGRVLAYGQIFLSSLLSMTTTMQKWLDLFCYLAHQSIIIINP